jgi:hypothetical protein
MIVRTTGELTSNSNAYVVSMLLFTNEPEESEDFPIHNQKRRRL